MDHNEDIDKEIRISLSIFWDIAAQVGNEVMRYLSNSFIYVACSPSVLTIHWMELEAYLVAFVFQNIL